MGRLRACSEAYELHMGSLCDWTGNGIHTIFQAGKDAHHQMWPARLCFVFLVAGRSPRVTELVDNGCADPGIVLETFVLIFMVA